MLGCSHKLVKKEDFILLTFNPHILIKTRHTHSVNASCSYEVHEDIICIHTNGSLEDVALL